MITHILRLRCGLRRLSAVILILSIFTTPSFAYTYRLKGDWNEYKSDHFIIYYHWRIPNEYIREFTRKCESYYKLLTNRLGFNRFDFWLWDKRARIVIYRTQEDYVKDTGRPRWSAASVHIQKKFISTFYFEKDFFDTVLPHELTHIILREFIGRKTAVPLWFEEGVATASEKASYMRYLAVANELVEKNVYISIPDMEIAGAAGVRLPTIFYATSASLIIFLLENYNDGDFVNLCRELRDGVPFYEAMRKVYGIEDAKDLDKKFLIFLNSKSYEEIIGREDLDIEW